MTFIATVKNVFIYPKEEDYLCFIIVEQTDQIIKVAYRSNWNNVSDLITHRGPVRFYSLKESRTSYYKQMEIPMYDVSSFALVSLPDNNPTDAISNDDTDKVLETTVPTCKFNVVLENDGI